MFELTSTFYLLNFLFLSSSIQAKCNQGIKSLEPYDPSNQTTCTLELNQYAFDQDNYGKYNTEIKHFPVKTTIICPNFTLNYFMGYSVSHLPEFSQDSQSQNSNAPSIFEIFTEKNMNNFCQFHQVECQLEVDYLDQINLSGIKSSNNLTQISNQYFMSTFSVINKLKSYKFYTQKTFQAHDKNYDATYPELLEILSLLEFYNLRIEIEQVLQPVNQVNIPGSSSRHFHVGSATQASSYDQQMQHERVFYQLITKFLNYLKAMYKTDWRFGKLTSQDVKIFENLSKIVLQRRNEYCLTRLNDFLFEYVVYKFMDQKFSMLYFEMLRERKREK